MRSAEIIVIYLDINKQRHMKHITLESMKAVVPVHKKGYDELFDTESDLTDMFEEQLFRQVIDFPRRLKNILAVLNFAFQQKTKQRKLLPP